MGRPEKIISGGQTGVDRAALDAALSLGVECGGWCPRGRRSEDGPIPARYPLEENGSPSYPARTRMNITNSDGTLILLLHSVMDRGTHLTLQLCRELRKPCLIYEMGSAGDQGEKQFHEWIRRHRIRVLNVAGCRESTCRGVGDAARALLIGWLV